MRLLHAALVTWVLTLVSGSAGVASDDEDGHAPVRVGAFEGYLVKVRSSLSVAGHSGEAVEAMTRDAVGDGWTAVPSGIPLEYRLVPGLEAAGRSTSTPAAAWERVHRLRRLPTVERAEPVFEQWSGEAGSLPVSGECKPAWPHGWESGDDAARRDSTWSLKATHGANVEAAWTLFEGSGGAPGGGITVGHPDTGYHDHPAIRDALFGRGFDFFDQTSDALDESDEGRLQWPGHGTRTASVIAGRRDFSLYGDQATSPQISGVAYGAKVMPLRVANRVVLLDGISRDMGNLALAIHSAAIGDPNFVRRQADVISLSLGGAPSRSVLDALRVAKARNVIVLAAAGNRVPLRQVVFPARYDEAIAVAASNVRSEPWEGTSRGEAVVVSAPGENVWVATRKQRGSRVYDCVQMATGTSYAVALTAGVAALWLSYRADEIAEVDDRVGMFSVLAKVTARRPAEKWNAAAYGAGILNARRLLDEELPELAAKAGAVSNDDLVALSALLPGSRTSFAHGLLFGCSAEATRQGTQVGHLGDELAFLFVTDATAAAALMAFEEGVSEPGSLGRLRRVVLSRSLSPTLRSQLLAVAGGRAGSEVETRDVVATELRVGAGGAKERRKEAEVRQRSHTGREWIGDSVFRARAGSCGKVLAGARR